MFHDFFVSFLNAVLLGVINNSMVIIIYHAFSILNLLKGKK